MWCEACGDDGMIAIVPTRPDGSIDTNARWPAFVPCPICGWSKVSHCCESDPAEPYEPPPYDPQEKDDER